MYKYIIYVTYNKYIDINKYVIYIINIYVYINKYTRN